MIPPGALDLLLPQPNTVDVAFRWATVTSVDPLRIRLDGEDAALPLTPDSLVDPRSLAPGDRVRVELGKRRLIIHGVNGGGLGLGISSAGMSWADGWKGLGGYDTLRYQVFPALGLVYTYPVLPSPTTNIASAATSLNIIVVTDAPFAPASTDRGNYPIVAVAGQPVGLLSVQNVGTARYLQVLRTTAIGITTGQYIGIPGLWWPWNGR